MKQIDYNKFPWIDIYDELANKILEYKDKSKRSDLARIVSRAFSLACVGSIQYGQDEDDDAYITVEEVGTIDPFTLLASINGFSPKTRTKVLNGFASNDSLRLRSHVPNDYFGAPNFPPSLRKAFAWRTSTSFDKAFNERIDFLWDAFELIVDIKNGDKTIDDPSFASVVSKLQNYNSCAAAKCTSCLYCIAPDIFVSLDKYSQKEIFDLILPDTEYMEEGKNRIEGKNYVTLIKDLKDYADRTGTNFVEIANDSYLHRTELFNSDNVLSEADTDKKEENEIGQNIIVYGIPGSGKSYTINQRISSSQNDDYIERIVFHPDYTYSDFVGQILPVENSSTLYDFVPGPMTRILKKANDNSNKMCYLVIEEVNRGNAPAIFGDIFQLLDRSNGVSEYPIKNPDIATFVYNNPEHNVILPRNLTIICTMNTSDQNVFTLDTAFKRRWSMEFIPDDIDSCSFKDCPIKSNTKNSFGTITWKLFHDTINEFISNEASNLISYEDKRLGAWFVTSEEELELKKFTNKVLRYLWDDVAKSNKELIFNSDIKTFEQVYQILNITVADADEFFEQILRPDIYEKMIGAVDI